MIVMMVSLTMSSRKQKGDQCECQAIRDYRVALAKTHKAMFTT